MKDKWKQISSLHTDSRLFIFLALRWKLTACCSKYSTVKSIFFVLNRFTLRRYKKYKNNKSGEKNVRKSKQNSLRLMLNSLADVVAVFFLLLLTKLFLLSSYYSFVHSTTVWYVYVHHYPCLKILILFFFLWRFFLWSWCIIWWLIIFTTK